MLGHNTFVDAKYFDVFDLQNHVPVVCKKGCFHFTVFHSSVLTVTEAVVWY